MTRFTSLLAALALSATPVLADEVTDTLSSALQAYEEGDIDYAIEELDYAKGLLNAMKTQALEAFLPPAPDGWTLEVESDMGSALSMMGGGAGTQGDYSNGTDTFTITIMANNPMITAFGGMISNASVLGMNVIRIGRQKVLEEDGQLSTLVDNRILVQAEGAETEVMLPVLETMDFAALADFGG